MLPFLSAVDVLLIVLAIAFVAALAGWAGGAGGAARLRGRLSTLEDFAGPEGMLDCRVKRREGNAGQVATQKRKTELQQREQEAENLARQLAAVGGRGRRPRIATDQDEDLAAELLDKQLGLNPPKEAG